MPFFPPSGDGAPLGPGPTNAAPGTVITADRIRYAKVGGNNALSGTNWAEAYEDVSYAASVVDGLGGGTVLFENGTLANSVTGAGLWLRGPYDIGNGGSGWTTLSGNNIEFSCVPTINTFLCFGMGEMTPKGGTWSGPPMQVCGMNGGGFKFKNIRFNSQGSAFPSGRLGLSSPLSVWSNGATYAIDTCVTYSGTSYVSLVNGNVGHQPDSSPSQWTNLGRTDGLGPSLTVFGEHTNCCWTKDGANTGPALDFGFTFWMWFNQCVALHNAPAAPGGDNSLNCSVRYITHPSGSLGVVANYLQFWNDCRMGGGGIYSRGSTTLFIDHMFAENMNYPGWYGDNSFGGEPDGYINDFQIGDSSVGTVLVNKGSKYIITIGSWPTSGPVNASVSDGQTAMSVNPQGTGLLGPAVFASHDGGRSLFGPSSALYPNVAADPGPTTSGTTTGPDGRSDSAYAINGDYILYQGAPAVGDMVAYGTWVNSAAINSGYMFLTNQSAGTATLFTSNGGSKLLPAFPANGWALSWFPGTPWADNEWAWMWGWFRMDAFSSSSSIQVQLRNGVGKISRPWVIKVPATDNVPLTQVARWAMHAAPTPVFWNGGHIPVTPAAGSVALWPGQKLAFKDQTLGAWKYLDIDNGAVRIT